MRNFFRVRGWRAFFLIFSIITLSVIAFTNCSGDLESPKVVQGPGIIVYSDPVRFVTEEPILSPRFSCDGKQLKYSKYLGSTTKEVVVPGKEIHIPDSVVKRVGYLFPGQSSTISGIENPEKIVPTKKSSWVPDWGTVWDLLRGALWFALVIITFICFVIFLAWIAKKLIEFGKRLLRDSSNHSNPPVPTHQEHRSRVGIADLSEDERKNLITEVKTEVMEELDSDDEFTARIDRVFYKHVEDETRILQQTGGRVDCVIGNAMYTIEIPPQNKKEEEKPENEQKS